jgi:hypothetical protein
MVRRKRHQDQEQDKQNVDLLTNVHGDSVREKNTIKTGNCSLIVLLLRIESAVSEDCDMICKCSIYGAVENISNDLIENYLVTRSRRRVHPTIDSFDAHSRFSIDSRTISMNHSTHLARR